MTTVNLLDQIIQPGDDRRRRRCCMNRSGWIAFFHRKRSINSFLVARACRVEPSSGGRSSRPRQVRRAPATRARPPRRARARAAPFPAHAGWSQVALDDAELVSIGRSQSVSVWFGDHHQDTNSIMSCHFFFLCRGIELARLLLEQDYSESKQASTHGSSNISFANMCNSSYCCKLEVTNSGVHLTESYGG